MPLSKKRIKKTARKGSRKPQGRPGGHVITLEGDLRSEVPPSVQCTCGWVEGPSTKLMELGNAARDHAKKTGHKLREH